MAPSRTQSGLKAASEKSSKFLSNLKGAVRSAFSSSSESSNEEKGREQHKNKLRGHPDLRSSQEEGDWAQVYQEVLADCVPDKNPDKYRSDQGMSLEEFRALADQDQLFGGSRRPLMDEAEAALYGVQLRVNHPRPLDEHELAARKRRLRAEAVAHEQQIRAESRRHPMDEREDAARRRQPRDELTLNEEQLDVQSRLHSTDECQDSASSSSSLYETEAEAHEAQRRAEGQLRAEAQLRADSAHWRQIRAETVARVEAAAREDELRPETRRFIN